MLLENKIALITGASSGIGHEAALLAAKEGATVYAMARRKERLAQLEEEAQGLAGKVIAVAGDVSKEEDCERVVKTMIDAEGRIDILVNNAGVMDDFIVLENVTNELWDWIFDVNVKGVMYLSRLIVPEMEKNGGGNIVNVASIGGLQAARAGVAYTASKHAVIGMTKNIGFTYAEAGIRCNAIAPGGVKTEITEPENMANVDPKGIQFAMKSPAVMDTMGDAIDIANAIVFLASDLSKFINATTIVADGGLTAY